MSVATVEHLTAVPPLENPCPDLPCWSLNQEQKVRGLTFLQRTKKELGERQLQPLRIERKELQEKYDSSDCRIQQLHIARQIKSIDASAMDIQSRWS